MRIDTNLRLNASISVAQVAKRSKKADLLSFGAVWVSETQHDLFLHLVLVAAHTKVIMRGIGIGQYASATPSF
jgi:hypothetical protein